MIVPGSNLLALAMGPISRQTLQHRTFVSRAVNAAGDWSSTFATAVSITGSMQPVNKALYQALGLDFAKNYSTLYTSSDVRPVARDREGDLLTFGGRTWQAISDQDWRGVDGWRKILCVEVPA